MLAGIGAAVRSDAQLSWVPTVFLDAQDVSASTDLPVWVPGQGDSAGFEALAYQPSKATPAPIEV